jgi:hypothetical protein
MPQRAIGVFQHAWFKDKNRQIGYATVFSLMKCFMVLAANVALDPNNIDFLEGHFLQI